MKQAQSFLKRIDEIKFAMAESVDIEPYKQAALQEYLDKNKDKQLALATYDEGEPVVVSDDYAPLARKHGKVISHGVASGTVKIRFEDGEYDVPEHHVTRKDAIANESKHSDDAIKRKHDHDFGNKNEIEKLITEVKCYALMEDGTLTKVLVSNPSTMLEAIENQLGKSVLALFPMEVSEEFMKTALVEREMTDFEKSKREDVVMALKKNKKELERKYGDKWESVMYAIAIKQAMSESLFESAEDVVYKQKVGSAEVKIVRVDNKYRVTRIDNGAVEADQTFSNIVDAEQFAQSLQ